MDADLKRQWVDALRSGKYKQGEAYLKAESESGTRYCCLGVLCDLIDDTAWVPSEGDGIYAYVDEHTRNVAWLPHRVSMSTGLSQSYDDEFEYESKLSHLNDEGVRFEAIADWIEQNILED